MRLRQAANVDQSPHCKIVTAQVPVKEKRRDKVRIQSVKNKNILLSYLNPFKDSTILQRQNSRHQTLSKAKAKQESQAQKKKASNLSKKKKRRSTSGA